MGRCLTGADAGHGRFLFIGGLHRSGTSLLHRMLRDHPDVTGFTDSGVPEDEGQHLQSVYPAAKAFGGPGRFALDPRSAMDEHSPLVNDESRARLLSEWEPRLDLTKPVRVEKSPPNLVRSRFLQALFPDARFLFIVRHPAVVTMAEHRRGHGPIADLLANWTNAHERLLEDLPALSDSRLIRYEDLVAEPEKAIAAILNWLGLPPYATQEMALDRSARYWAAFAQTQPEAYRGARLRELSAAFGYRFEEPFVAAPEPALAPPGTVIWT